MEVKKILQLNDNYYLAYIADVCHTNLSDEHRKYMRSRGISDRVIDEFSIGTFQSDIIFENVPVEFLQSKRILFRNKGKLWSEFNDRIIFPIRHYNGSYVGISGRILNSDDEERAKYYNSSYAKASVLYGMDKAKRPALVKNAIIIVEGNLDVMSAFQAGVDNVVALCGTAISKKHLGLILPYCSRVALCMDNDEAGRAARGRAIKIMEPYTSGGLLDVGIINLPDGVKDLNDVLVKNGAASLESLLSQVEYTNNRVEIHRDYSWDEWASGIC